MPELDKDELKAAVKEGIEDWLDKQFQTFGIWSARFIASIILAGLAYLAARGFGWHR